MVLINNVKYACEPCMRGHRSSKCIHHDRVLVKVRKPGRPLSTCPHDSSKALPNGYHLRPMEIPSCDCDMTKVAIPKHRACPCPIDLYNEEFNKPAAGPSNVPIVPSCCGSSSGSAQGISICPKILPERHTSYASLSGSGAQPEPFRRRTMAAIPTLAEASDHMRPAPFYGAKVIQKASQISRNNSWQDQEPSQIRSAIHEVSEPSHTLFTMPHTPGKNVFDYLDALPRYAHGSVGVKAESNNNVVPPIDGAINGHSQVPSQEQMQEMLRHQGPQFTSYINPQNQILSQHYQMNGQNQTALSHYQIDGSHLQQSSPQAARPSFQDGNLSHHQVFTQNSVGMNVNKKVHKVKQKMERMAARSAQDHVCTCGDGCACLACASHPFNKTMKIWVGNMKVIQEDQTIGLGNHNPQSVNSSVPMGITSHAPFSDFDFNGQNASISGLGSVIHPEDDDDESETMRQASPADFYLVQYPDALIGEDQVDFSRMGEPYHLGIVFNTNNQEMFSQQRPDFENMNSSSQEPEQSLGNQGVLSQPAPLAIEQELGQLAGNNKAGLSSVDRGFGNTNQPESEAASQDSSTADEATSGYGLSPILSGSTHVGSIGSVESHQAAASLQNTNIDSVGDHPVLDDIDIFKGMIDYSEIGSEELLWPTIDNDLSSHSPELVR